MTDRHIHERTKMIKGRLISAALYLIPFIILLHFLDISLPENISPPCLLRAFTGWYCPGCGGTRAIRSLLKGDILISMVWHPVVVSALYLLWLYLVSFAVAYVSAGKIPEIKPRLWHFYIITGIILLSWLVKNVMLLGFGLSPEFVVEKIRLIFYNSQQG